MRDFLAKKIDRENLWRISGIVVSIMVGVGLVFFILRRVLLEPGLAPGSDVTSFAHTTKLMVDYFLTHHRLPPVDLSWYAGFEHQPIPPLVYYYLAIPYLLTHDIELSTRILHPVAISLIFISMFFVMRKEGRPTLNSFVSAIVYTFMPQIFMSIQTWTKLISLFALPVLFYFTNKILTDDKNRLKYIVFLALGFAYTVYAHPMNGVVYSISLLVYAFFYSFFSPKIDTWKVWRVFIGAALGIILASNFLIPFIFQSTQEIFARSTLWEYSTIVNPVKGLQFKDTINIMGGWLVILIIPIIVMLRKREAKIAALYLSGLLTMIIAFLYALIPLGTVFPFRLTYSYIWLYFSCFAFAYVFGLLIPSSCSKKIISHIGRFLLAAVLLVIYFLIIRTPSNFKYMYNLIDTKAEVQLSRVIADISNNGRLYYSHYPLGEFTWIQWLYGNKPQIEGHYYGVSQLGRQLALMYDATHNNYPEYVLKKFKELNVRFFVANQFLWDLKSPIDQSMLGQDLIKKAQDEGFKEKYEIDVSQGNAVPPSGKMERFYYLDRTEEYVQPLNEDILVIGQYGPTLAAAASPLKVKMLEASSIYLDDYDLDFLKRFKVVFLYGFAYHNKTKAEDLVREYVANGGEVVIDMFGMKKSQIEEEPIFLGVTGNNIKITSTWQIESAKETKGLFPGTFQLPSEVVDALSEGELESKPVKEWNALEYYNLDQVWARFSNEDDFYGIVGAKNISEGKVVFVGANLFYHLYLTHNEEELKMIAYILKNVGYELPQSEKAVFEEDPSFKATQENLEADYWRFKVSNEKDRLALVSLAYSPNWKAYLDSQEIPVYEAENLMVVKIPQGDHVLEVKYQSFSKIKIAGISISIFTLVVLVYLLILNRKNQNNLNKN